MIHVSASSVIDAPLERVWALVRDFGSIGRWLPGIASCGIEEGGAVDRIGSVRRLDMGESGILREELLGLSETEHTVTYAIVETDLPVSDYRSTIELLPVTDADRTFIRWSGWFEAPAEHADTMRRRMPRDIYQAGFDRLKTIFASGREGAAGG